MVSCLPSPPSLAKLSGQHATSLFLDFDGTLVPIAPTPDGIAVPGDLGSRLETLADRMKGRVALVSGRALDNLETHLGHVAIAQAGSHGIHRISADGSSLGESPAEFPGEVTTALAKFADSAAIDLERKSHGAALHFRSAPEREAEAHEFAKELARQSDLTVKTGKCVVELVRHGADKAGAVEAFMVTAPFAGALPIFIGDDVTDEDGFRAANALGGFGILVGEPRESLAKYSLKDVKDVYDWLDL